MSFVSKEIRRFGYIVVNDVQVLAAQYHFECDSASDLPTQTQFQNDKNVFLFMGSTAHTIDTDAKYEMDSSGAWVQQSQPWQPLADYSVLTNKPQINGHTLTGNQSGEDLGLQNTLTFDSTPTQNSANPVRSGGIWTEQQKQETEIGVVANAGAKNLLKVSVTDAKSNAGNAGFTWTGNTASKNHVNFKINSDLTVDVSSDAGYITSDITIFYLTDGTGAYPNTILNGCPSGGSNTTYELRTATPVKSDYGSGVEITSDSTTNVVIIIRSGWSGALTFKPMIRPAAITDPTFVPYAKTNRELTVLTDEDRAALVELVDNGAKNLIPVNSATSTQQQPTMAQNVPFTSNGGEYVISYASNNNSGVLSFGFRDANNALVTAIEIGNATKIKTATIPANVSYFNIYTTSYGDYTNIMICTAAAYAISPAFVPYRPSWQEMWDAIQALQ